MTVKVREGDNGDKDSDASEVEDEEDENEEDVIAKYRALLGGQDKGGEDEDDDDDGEDEGNMEMVFEDEKPIDAQNNTMTPWEKYLNKRKDKKRAKRQAAKKGAQLDEEPKEEESNTKKTKRLFASRMLMNYAFYNILIIFAQAKGRTSYTNRH
jgi:hypothetical protein